MVTFFKLFPVAPVNFNVFPLPFRRVFGTSIFFSPFKYCAVNVCSANNCFGVPSLIILPPKRPAFGPISITQSARSIMSLSCSTTKTELPISRKFSSELISRSLSLWCKPILGSSKIYNTPTNCEPICVARRMRCASPPESDLELLLNAK